MRSAFLGCIVLVLCYLLKNSVRNPKFILTKDFWMFLYNGLVIGAKSAMTVAAGLCGHGHRDPDLRDDRPGHEHRVLHQDPVR